ncbi:Zn-dependent hydrolase [Oscillospiraceae bacterium OttesenSCG-928-G22]|nr:Zn-dependent hydrolase [Oscillospiraceae bacterium OttesenSCG-928-G22]
MRVNKDRIWKRLETLAEIMDVRDGMYSRYPFTESYRKVQTLAAEWMQEAGLTTRVDAADNLIGRKEGSEGGPAIVAGSHLDTTANGGAYDGIIGVVGAIEAVQCMKDAGIVSKYPIEVIVFNNEEGTRFAPGLFGSKCITGYLAKDYVSRSVDPDGISFTEAMKTYGLDASKLPEAKRDPSEFKHFFELHIEQAGLLESKDIPVGIVSGISGILQNQFTVEGQIGHAGAVPMEGRRDPLPAVAEIALEIEATALRLGNEIRGTVGVFDPSPDAHNIIPSAVSFSMDFRCLHAETLAKAKEHMLDFINKTVKKRNLVLKPKTEDFVNPIFCDEAVVNLMTDGAKELGIETLYMPSGAAHDAMVMAKICPMNMIFVRSKDGLSHCRDEYSSPEDIAMGADVLLYAMAKLCQE